MKALATHVVIVLIPAIVSVGFVALSIFGFKDYSWMMFLMMPLVLGFLSGFLANYVRPTKFSAGVGYASGSMAIIAAAIILTKWDGIICLIMAFPAAFFLMIAGVAFGAPVGIRVKQRRTATLVTLGVIAMLPALLAAKAQRQPEVPVRKVVTTIHIAAPAERVWETVIAFPRIEERPGGVFRFGIAYPIEAEIRGTGVGAIRYCRFSTGDFVEPITTWDQPRLLAFDVTSSPEPMRETSIYDEIHAPHLRGFMRSKQGQFRIIERPDGVSLEGTTWYQHDLSPQWYWGPITDQIIHAIHRRVLDHIKRTVEPQPAFKG